MGGPGEDAKGRLRGVLREMLGTVAGLVLLTACRDCRHFRRGWYRQVGGRRKHGIRVNDLRSCSRTRLSSLYVLVSRGAAGLRPFIPLAVRNLNTVSHTGNTCVYKST